MAPSPTRSNLIIVSPVFHETIFHSMHGSSVRPDYRVEVWTTETTHRDGQQGGLPLSTEQSLAIYDVLCRFTGTSGAIRQAEFFVYRPSDRAALEGALERFRGGAAIEPTTWIRATAKDVALFDRWVSGKRGCWRQSPTTTPFTSSPPAGESGGPDLSRSDAARA